MPRRPVRTLAALALAAAFLLPAAVPAAAREPYRPLPNYHPDFVTQREPGRTTADCLWASAAMLVEKWTAGQVDVSKDRLRSLSGDLTKGSNFRDLTPALRKLGLNARWSPEGGDHVTWSSLRSRVGKGAGAILLGDYHDLPRYYGRWAPGFWKKKGKKDNHAIYLDRYDRRTDKFWVMDPLAPAGWKGEWIPTRYLMAFAWQSGGAVWAMVTPKAQRAPFSGVKLGAPAPAVRDGRLTVSWKVRKAPKGWKLPKVRVLDRVERLDDPASLGVLSAVSAPAATPGADKTKPAARYARKTIRAGRAIPAKPGAYRIALSIGERRFGRTVATSSTVVYVPGERRGSILVGDPGTAVAGERLALRVTVMNTGSVDWTTPAWLKSNIGTTDRGRDTVLRASWVRSGDASDDADAATGPDPADILAVNLASGEAATANVVVPTPKVPGRWVLTFDLVDQAGGSFAADGSAPTTIEVRIVDPRTKRG